MPLSVSQKNSNVSNNLAPELQIQELEKELHGLRLDSALASIASKVGAKGFDKRESVRIKTPTRLSREELSILFEQDKFAAKLVESLPNIATRKHPIYSLGAKNGEEIEESDAKLTAAMQDLIDKSMPYFREAYVTARLYGGSCIVMGCNDNVTDLTKPLIPEQIKTIDWLDVRAGGIGGQLEVAYYQEDATQPDYDEPLIYQFTDRVGTQIHKSRLLIFHGIKVNKRRSREYYYGFGGSVVNRAWNDLRDFNISVDSIAIAVQDFNRLVVKIAGLANLLNAKKKKEVEERLQIMNYVTSVLNVWLLDPQDEHQILSRNFNGVAEMLEILKSNLGANSELPHTSFFNQSPDGITSGSSEAAELNQVVATSQNDNIRPNLLRLIDLYHHCKQGVTGGKVPEDWSITFPTIYEETELEKQELAGKKAAEREIYLKYQVVTPDEVAEAIARDIPLGAVIDLAKREEDRAKMEEMLSTPEGVTMVMGGQNGNEQEQKAGEEEA